MDLEHDAIVIICQSYYQRYHTVKPQKLQKPQKPQKLQKFSRVQKLYVIIIFLNYFSPVVKN